MPANPDFLMRLSDLRKAFEGYGYEKDESGESEEDYNRAKEFYLQILKDTCTLVREAETVGVANLEVIVAQANELISDGINFCYNDGDLYDFMPSFAYSEDFGPLIKDSGQAILGYRALTGLLSLMRPMVLAQGREFEPEHPFCVPEAWDPNSKPHANTTLLARFRRNISTLSATAAHPLANTIYQARAEVTSESSYSPVHLTISPGSRCMAFIAMGGWKNRAPMLLYYDVDKQLFKQYAADVGLADVAYHSTIDETRNLIFIADDSRIKSYAWGLPGSDQFFEDPLATHTLNSNKSEGPLAVLSHGHVIRAGKGRISVWDIDSLETHGPKGSKRIGAAYNRDDTWRDDPDMIEDSKGSARTTEVKFQDKKLEPAIWTAHLSQLGSMICASDPRTMQSYSCFVLDLEHGGKTSGYFLGHGGTIDCFSTSATDPNVFATACSDQICRVYDTRHPLPAMSFETEGRSTLLVHPDGIPTLFTGCESGEQIKLWDIRAHAAVYELATGNNAVASMVWDSRNNSLYAATSCAYMDRLGYNHDYRRAKVPKTRADTGDNMDVEDDDDDVEDDDEDDDDDFEHCWPQNAYHAENYFGHCFDAAEHRIYRYAFTPEADTAIVPAYGQASLSHSFW